MANVLVVDDDRMILHSITHVLAEADLEITTAGTAAEALESLKKKPAEVALLDVTLPDGTGLEVFRRMQEIDPKLPVIFITMRGGSETAIEAMKLGAFDYLPKPLDLVKLRDMVMQGLAIRRLTGQASGPDRNGPAADTPDLMIGNSPKMLEVYKTIGRVASQDIPVLILGESGTGKELVARAIFQHGRRAKGPFLALNCAAIPEALLESELFGHEKGAFTGATSQRIGKFEQCHGGTIFLDEIGDMPLLLQAKMLRVLQEQKFERVGGNESIRTDVRVVSATHRDLETLVEKNQFRSDLLFRLKGVTVHLPPLRERKEDLRVLVEHFLARYARELRREVRGISNEGMAAIENYAWPGNIRELQSALKFAVLQATGSVVIPEFLPRELQLALPKPPRPAVAPAPTLAPLATPAPVAAPIPASEAVEAPPDEDFEDFLSERIAANSENLYDEALERMERQLLTTVLKHTAGNQSKAAKILGITRGNLRNKIRTLGIHIAQDVRIENDELIV